MVAWSQLVLPILLSAVLVFVVSSVLHTVLKYHHKDIQKLGNEEEVRAALKKGNASVGQYFIPYCADHKEMNTPEQLRKFEEGPVGLLMLRPAGRVHMGPVLIQWLIYTIVVSALAAYIAKSTLTSGADYLAVFQVVGASAWLAYAWQAPADSIWKGQPWSVTTKVLIDGLIYAAVTAGAFGWLWPR
jgi:hypothetical protein